MSGNEGFTDEQLENAKSAKNAYEGGYIDGETSGLASDDRMAEIRMAKLLEENGILTAEESGLTIAGGHDTQDIENANNVGKAEQRGQDGPNGPGF